MSRPNRYQHFKVCLAIAAALLVSRPTLGGGGPETTLVVANADSQLSLLIANEYISMRDIPAGNLLRLRSVPLTRTITIEEFREKILNPILAFMRDHEIEDSIDTIAYSVSFPYAVDFSRETKGKPRLKDRTIGRHASLTGLTFFARRVAAGDLGYLGLNHYFRRNMSQTECTRGRAFDDADRKAYNQTQRALKKAELSDAETGLESLLNKYPNNARVWFDIARTRAAAGRQDDALDALEKATGHCFSDVLEARRDRHLKSLSESPRFARILAKMGALWGPFQEAQGFRSRYVWTRNSSLFLASTAYSMDRYFLSVMLGYSGLRGNSIPEIISYLSRSADVDGTAAKGSVYLMLNRNVRSQTRWPLFPETVSQIQRRGGKAEIIERDRNGQDGIVPKNRTDIIGLSAGTATFDWAKSGSAMLPGAIAESLTSYAGHFEKAKQTKLSAFLRHGAAGSSGAVAEPYSLQVKFPVPLMHVHYADGSSLAEAFYQSIEAPYQLLVVGDPLARPFAEFAKVDFEVSQSHRGPAEEIRIAPSIVPPQRHTIGGLELWIDGRRLADTRAVKELSWTAESDVEGWREIRLVAYDGTPVETRSYAKKIILQGSDGCQLSLAPPPSEWRWAEPLTVRGLASAGSEIEISSGHHRLAAAESRDGTWEAEVAGQDTGPGPVEIRAVEHRIDGTTCLGQPWRVRFTVPAALAGQWTASPTAGFDTLLTYPDGSTETKRMESLAGRFRKLRGESGEPTRLQSSGAFHIDTAGFYEIVVDAVGDVSLSLDGRQHASKAIVATDAPLIMNASLERGWHALNLDIHPVRGTAFRVLLMGETVAHVVGDK